MFNGIGSNPISPSAPSAYRDTTPTDDHAFADLFWKSLVGPTALAPTPAPAPTPPPASAPLPATDLFALLAVLLGAGHAPNPAPAAPKPSAKPVAAKPSAKPVAAKPHTAPAATKPHTAPATTKPHTAPATTKPHTAPTPAKPNNHAPHGAAQPDAEKKLLNQILQEIRKLKQLAEQLKHPHEKTETPSKKHHHGHGHGHHHGHHHKHAPAAKPSGRQLMNNRSAAPTDTSGTFPPAAVPTPSSSSARFNAGPNGGIGKWSDAIKAASDASGLDPHLIGGIMWAESRGNPNDPSKNSDGTTDLGLMQISNERWKREVSPRLSAAEKAKIKQLTGKDPSALNMNNSADNVIGGALEMSQWIEDAGGDVAKGLRGYNSGDFKFNGIGSKHYSQNVLTYQDELQNGQKLSEDPHGS